MASFTREDDALPISAFFRAIASYPAIPAVGKGGQEAAADRIVAADPILVHYEKELEKRGYDWRTCGVPQEGAAEDGALEGDVEGMYVNEGYDGEEADVEGNDVQTGISEDQEQVPLSLDEQMAFQHAFMNWRNGDDDGGLGLIGGLVGEPHPASTAAAARQPQAFDSSLLSKSNDDLPSTPQDMVQHAAAQAAVAAAAAVIGALQHCADPSQAAFHWDLASAYWAGYQAGLKAGGPREVAPLEDTH